MPDFGIPPGGDRQEDDQGQPDRSSVYAGHITPTLYHKLTRAFYQRHLTDWVPRSSADVADGVGYYHAGIAQAETVYEDVSFLTVVVLREHYQGMRAHGRRRLRDTFVNGGLDFLGREMRRMDFVPEATRRHWRDLGTYTGFEAGDSRGHEVQPASIPRGDELLAYAATLRLRSDRLRSRATQVLGRRASIFLEMNVDQRRAWTQLAFGRSGGFSYDERRGDQQLRHRRAGLVTVLGALLHHDAIGSRPLHPNGIFDVLGLRNMHSVRVAQARAVEARLLDEGGLFRLIPRTIPATMPLQRRI